MKKALQVICVFLMFALMISSVNAEEINSTETPSEEITETTNNEEESTQEEIQSENTEESVLEEDNSLVFNLPTEEGAYNFSAIESNEEIDLISVLEISATDSNNDNVEVYVKDNGGLDLSVPNTYSITIGAINPLTSEEETTSFNITVHGEEIVTPLSTCDASHVCVVTSWAEFKSAVADVNADLANDYTITVTGTLNASDDNVGALFTGINKITIDGTGIINGLTGSNEVLKFVNCKDVTLGTITIQNHEDHTGLQAVTIDKSTMNLRGTQFLNNTTTSTGGGVTIEGIDSTLNMYEGTLIDGNTGGTSAAVNMWGTTSAHFNMYGGTISNNSSTDWIGAVRVDSDNSANSSMNMYGGTICNNKATGTPGRQAGVYVNGTFTMEGGEIYENTAVGQFGGVSVNGTAIIKGGSIHDNTASSYGGGLYVKGSLTMTGGSVVDNKTTAGDYGGVIVEDGPVNISGGNIDRNIASGNCGGLTLGNVTQATISGGSISNNETGSNGNGGGLALTNSNVVITGGKIEGNKSKNYAGVILIGTSTLEIRNGEIKNNIASSNGGGVYINSTSSLTMSGGQIEGNIATAGNMGGIYVAGGIMNLSGGTISNNTAAGGGGGVFLNNATVTMTGGSVSNNTGTAAGGGFALQGTTTLSMSGGVISDNTSAQGKGIFLGANATLNLSDDASIATTDNVYISGVDHKINVLNNLNKITTAKPISITTADLTNSTDTSTHGNQVVNYYSDAASASADVNKLFVSTQGMNIIQDDVTGEQLNYLIYGLRQLLNFDTDGGSSINSIGMAGNTVLESSDKYNAVGVPTKSGYTFDGWYVDSAKTTKVDNTTAMVAIGDMTLYAKWKLNPTPTPTPAPSVSTPTTTGRTCQDDGYPAGYYWNGNACVISTGYKVPNTGVKDNTSMYYVVFAISLIGIAFITKKQYAKRK